MRLRHALVPAVAVLLLVPAAGAAAPTVRPPGRGGPYGDEVLSNERTVTRVAYVNEQSRIRSGPRSSARTVGRLRYRTEDGPPELYLVLRSHRDSLGHVWLQVRIPRRPNGKRGWVPEESLSALRTVRTFMRIDRRSLRATLYRAGRGVWSSRIGVGKPSTPTPSGHFYIRERLRNLGGAGVYGPWAFGTSAYSRLSDWPGGGVVGIHGTNEPGLIPGRPSHGCIRMPNAKISRLAKLMPVGTPVRIV
jgi:L,D-transpeptidase catalytic domain